MSMSHIINSNAATIVVDGEIFTIRRDFLNWNELMVALDAGDEARVKILVDIPESLKEVTSGRISVQDDGVYFNGEPLHTGLANRILGLIREGYQGLASPLTKFLDNLMDNPSRRSVQGLYEWLEKSNLPITDDGCFIAWKIVGPEFKDLYSGKFDNSPGQTVEVQRNEVDENIDQTCSYGLHFCSNEYLPRYGRAEGNKIVMVKVNPRDVVAFPRDYNTSKGRCCRYEVIREITRSVAPSLFGDSATVYDTAKPSFEAMGFYADDKGNVILIDADGNELNTGMAVNDDHSIADVTGGVQLLPSKRVIKL